MLLVGADYNTGAPEYLKDNDFEGNISAKNPNYCELTGLYWIWKRSEDGIVGLCHYRRFLTQNKKYFKKQGILRKHTIRRLLRQYDVILPEKVPFCTTVKEHFATFHAPEVWEHCKSIIAEKYPDYLRDFVWYEQQPAGFCYNMFISGKSLCDAYCAWLFDILAELEEVTDLSQYSAYNKRMYGFVAERLLNVWVHHKHLRVKEMPVYFTQDPAGLERIKRKIEQLFNKQTA